LKYLGLALWIASIASAISPAAELAYPVDVAVDGQGGVFIADHEAHALLKITPSGVEIIARGEGRPRTPLYGIRHIAPSVDGGFVASDPATMKLYRIDAEGAVTPLADDGRFVTPWGLVVEAAGSVLVVDRVSHVLRRVKSGGDVEDVVDVKSPRAVLVDKDGAIVVLTDDNLVRVSAGTTTPLAKSMPFEFPHDVVLNSDGNFYVSDGYARAIWRVGADGAVSTFVQGEPLVSPQGLALDRQGNLLVADPHARSIFSITPKGDVTRLAQ
jgi:sugar lactone lactonase YvrE